MGKRVNLLRTAGLATAVAVVGLAAATQASAYVVCNRFHECWRVVNRPVYPTTLGLMIYPDTWRAAHMGPRYRWLADRDDRGYYNHGVWRTY